jgi:hypothetical protein
VIEATPKARADRQVERHVDGLAPRQQCSAEAFHRFGHAGLEGRALAVHREHHLNSGVAQEFGQ